MKRQLLLLFLTALMFTGSGEKPANKDTVPMLLEIRQQYVDSIIYYQNQVKINQELIKRHAPKYLDSIK